MNRRLALRRLVGAVVGAPLAARAAQEHLVASPANIPSGSLGGAYGPPVSGAVREMPWALKQLQKWLGKERQNQRERAEAFQDALFGRLPPDIYALQSIQHHARARMHLRRYRESEVYGASKQIDQWYEQGD